MKKFAFIGAGSFGFTRGLVKDLLTFPAFYDCELRLMDIDAERLELITTACEKIRKALGRDEVKIVPTMSRAEALDGADGVVCTVFNGDIDIWRHEIEIPKEYGVDINVGDTRSIAGIFRAMRNIPLMLDICHDIEKYCPNAVFLNYTNPMSMLCRAMQSQTKVDVTGLCHSVQGTSKMLRKWLGVEPEKFSYLCAGINHTAFFLKLESEGVDLYPRLRQLVREDKAIYNSDIVLNEMLIHLDYYVTESSGHNSEYNQWFRKRPDLIEKYCSPHEGAHWNPGEYAFSLNLRLDRREHWREDIQNWIDTAEITPERSREYASNIFNARIGDGTPFDFNGNLTNGDTIPNLPAESCVEIPVVATKEGYIRKEVGPLPSHLAMIIGNTINVENLVVEAVLEKDKRKAFHAICMDPLTSAVCSLAEISEMCDRLFKVNEAFFEGWK